MSMRRFQFLTHSEQMYQSGKDQIKFYSIATGRITTPVLDNA